LTTHLLITSVKKLNWSLPAHKSWCGLIHRDVAEGRNKPCDKVGQVSCSS